jgi:uncharacterized protein YidB (DUF937 family)
MGLLDDLKGRISGALGGAQAQAAGNPLVAHVMQMLNDPKTGGLKGLVQSFHDKGLGGIVSSWVGTGANQPVSPEQVTQALGPEKMQQMAQAAGTNQGAVASQLASLLPSIIDKLTPQGSIPDSGALAKGLAALRSSLGVPPAPPTTPKS